MTDPLLRQRAKAQWEKIARKSQDLERDLTPEAARTVLHELQVHQIELEMQNEELQQSQLALEVTKARYFDLYELAPVGYLTVSEAGLILECNLTAASVLGVPREGVTKKRFSQLIAKEDQDAWYLLQKKLAATHEQINAEMRMVRGDGSSIWCMFGAANTQDELGAMVTRLTITNITEQKQAQSRLLGNAAALRAISQGVIITTLDFLIVTANAAFLTITCYSEAEVLGRNCNFLQGPDTDPHMVEAIRAALQQRKDFDGELLNYRKDGAPFWNALTISPVFAQNGNITHFVGVTRDITETVKAREALQYSHADLVASVSEKEALLKEVHHRVKNNLQVITSLLRLEAARSKADETKSVLGDMQGRIRAMAQLHESLYRSGTFASVDFGAYLKQLATQVFQTQGGLVRLTLDMGSVPVGMDQATTGGLLLNELITNCIKHGFPDGRSGEVRVALQPLAGGQAADAQWCLSVSDTGVGLPADFEERRKTSLGMQLVDDLSKQIKGTLVIDSAPDQGARFTVTFVAQKPAALVVPA